MEATLTGGMRSHRFTLKPAPTPLRVMLWLVRFASGSRAHARYRSIGGGSGDFADFSDAGKQPDLGGNRALVELYRHMAGTPGWNLRP